MPAALRKSRPAPRRTMTWHSGRLPALDSLELAAACTSSPGVPDDETPELTEEDFAVMRTMDELVSHRQPKKLITLRLDADVIDGFRSQGRGWQTRVNAVLKAYVGRHAVLSK